jgi:hypothetical protein
MAVAAETLTSNHWRLANEALPEVEQAAQSRLESFLGDTALQGEVVMTGGETVNDSTLLSAAQMARLGDVESRKLVETCVATDVMERLYKAGNETSVSLKMSDKHLEQNGRRMSDVHRNTLLYTHLIPPMLRRTIQEAKNFMTVEDLHAAGAMFDHDVVWFSVAATDMTDKQKKDYNFFLDTETCSIQRFSAESESDVLLETAFVAGKATPDSTRHDIAAIRAVGRRFDMSIDSSDSTDILQYLMLVPKTAIPNGVTDIVRWFDEAAGGTFYGEAKPQQDYVAYSQDCEARNKGFDGMVQSITSQLLAEAHSFKTPLDAILRLDKLSEQYCVTYAADHKEINTAIFGGTAAIHIDEYRLFMEQGETGRAEDSLLKAQKTAKSGSCPLFKEAELAAQSDDDAGYSSTEESSGKKKSGHCPYCKAKVFIDPCAPVITCWDCNARVVNGKVESSGNGGAKAREARRRQQAKEREAALARQVEKVFQQAELSYVDETLNSPNQAQANAQSSQITQLAGV